MTNFHLRSSPAPSLRAILAILCAVVATICLTSCAKSPPSDVETGPASPSVILISLDTARADLFGALSGRSPSLTPRLDELAADSVVFENAFVQAPHTLPSHMSMFTSLYPDVHGVKPNERTLPAAVPTLPQLLKRAGFHTIGLVTSEWLKPEFGFARGFDEYDLLPHRPTYADRVNARALDEIEDRAGNDAPFFLFLHYYDLHSDFEQGRGNKLPYYSPPSYRSHIDASEDGEEFCDAEGRCNTLYLMAADSDRRDLSQEEIDTIHSLYEAAAPHLDREMGTFLDALKKLGIYDSSLIVVTADHGEEFREHGRFIHSQNYDETIAVPLFIKLPYGSRAGTRIATVAETVDVMPTILHALGLDIPDSLQGESLLLPAPGEERQPPDAVASQGTINLTRYALRTADTKLILDLRSGRRELYDMAADPDEKDNLATERTGVADRMAQRLERLVRRNLSLGRELSEGKKDDEDTPLSPEERERLKALGYLN